MERLTEKELREQIAALAMVGSQQPSLAHGSCLAILELLAQHR
jgi:hypothetical protein